MKSLFPLEDFSARRDLGEDPDTLSAPQASAGPSLEDVEAAKVEAYDQGYQAGWDDAVRAQSQDKERIGADFARNLQDLGFTFHEARSHVINTLEPLLSEMISKVLPKLVDQTLGQTILEELLPLAEKASDSPVQIVVAVGKKAAIEALVDHSLTIPVEVQEEPTLTEGQVYLRLGELEQHIDMDGAIERIHDAINAVYSINEKALQYG